MDSLQGQPPVSSHSQDPDSKQSALCAAIGLKPHSRLLLIALGRTLQWSWAKQKQLCFSLSSSSSSSFNEAGCMHPITPRAVSTVTPAAAETDNWADRSGRWRCGLMIASLEIMSGIDGARLSDSLSAHLVTWLNPSQPPHLRHHHHLHSFFYLLGVVQRRVRMSYMQERLIKTDNSADCWKGSKECARAHASMNLPWLPLHCCTNIVPYIELQSLACLFFYCAMMSLMDFGTS